MHRPATQIRWSGTVALLLDLDTTTGQEQGNV